MYKTFLFVFMLSFSLPSLAQKEIITFDDYFTVRLGVSNSFNSFEINNQEDGSRFLISPNQKIISTVTFLFRSVEIDIGYTPTFLKFNNDDDKRGRSKLFALNLRGYLGKWMQSLDIYKTRGFYLADSNLDFHGGEIITLPDLKVFKIGGSTSYIFNDKFSFRAIAFQNEWQTKSSGSFIPRMSYYFTKFSDNTRQNSKFFDISVGPSYYYNWVLHKHLLLSIGGYTGIGLNVSTTKYEDTSFNEKLTSVAYDLTGRTAIGYNSNKFYTGITTNFNLFFHKVDRYSRIEDEQVFMEFYIGYRFKAPKSWLKAAKKVNSKLGLE